MRQQKPATGVMNSLPADRSAAQTAEEQRTFIEAFARVRLLKIINELTEEPPVEAAVDAEAAIHPDWSDSAKLALSGLSSEDLTDSCLAGSSFLHIDIARQSRSGRYAFLDMTGLSDKQRRDLFPLLSSRSDVIGGEQVSKEVQGLNNHLRWVASNGGRPELFTTYQRSIALHGRTQNTSGQVGSMGAALAFIDAIRGIAPNAIADLDGNPPKWAMGEPPPSPEDLIQWIDEHPDCTVKAILLKNNRALVFSSSKDVNIFQSLGAPYTSAEAARLAYTEVRNDQQARHQSMHEFAVGEVKTATDPANLHERIGLASRETQTELRTDRFLMMALLTPALLSGGVASRVMNNRDLTRFSHIFNLHHCWGWDGGRERHPEHWASFTQAVRVWCGL